MAPPSMLATLTFVLFFPSALPALGLTIPILSALTPASAALGTIRYGCKMSSAWIGSGVTRSDCNSAIEELWRADVQPREGQEYEFYTRGAPRLDFPLPLVITPRTHEYGGFYGGKKNYNGLIELRYLGTCVVSIVMLDMIDPSIFVPASSPSRSDVTRFEEIYWQAENIFRECVQRGSIPKVGWSYVGM